MTKKLSCLDCCSATFFLYLKYSPYINSLLCTNVLMSSKDERRGHSSSYASHPSNTQMRASSCWWNRRKVAGMLVARISAPLIKEEILEPSLMMSRWKPTRVSLDYARNLDRIMMVVLESFVVSSRALLYFVSLRE